MKHSLMKTIIYAAIIFIFVLLFSEFGLRFYKLNYSTQGKYGKMIFQEDEYVGFVLKKNLRNHVVMPEYGWNFIMDTDSNGNRGSRPLIEKAPGEFRILMLGDSFTFGFGVNSDQTFASLLEKKLRRETGMNVNVINAGVPSYGTLQEVRYLKAYAKKLEPDLVIVAFFDNDLWDNVIDLRFIDGSIQKNPKIIFGHTSYIIELFDKIIMPRYFHRQTKIYSISDLQNRFNELVQEAKIYCENNGMKFMIVEIPDRAYTKFRTLSDLDFMPPDRTWDLGPDIFYMYDRFDKLEQDPYFLEHHLNSIGHEEVSSALVDELLTRNSSMLFNQADLQYQRY